MLEVEAGNKTGIYYITVSNLPFNTQWTELKDFVRTVCEVDYVVVFNASTHAWVRVLGYEDYRKAFQLLNGGVFKGRHLVADCRNASQRISIRTLVDVGQPLRGPGFTTSPGALPDYAREYVHTDGYCEPLEAVMDGVGLEGYTYGYVGHPCGYTTGEYWPGRVYDEQTDANSRQGHDAKKTNDKGKHDKDKDKAKEREKGPVVPVIVNGSNNRRDFKADKKKKKQ
ncbi:hypothetical protein VUR80DRAFT_7652 [Thermomyces stellatus]